jgi:bifunctional N-acetylglucosamine-1-phosphate-uridyltransferase/glucosamine-1-phosphate-acetyltransferase GlmU-like protein
MMTQLNDTDVHPTAVVARTALVGRASRPLLDGRQSRIHGKTQIQRSAWIGDFCSIGQNVAIGAYSIVQEYSLIEAGARIGRHVLIRHRTNVGADVKIGDNCIISGHIGEGTVIGNNCRVFGQLIHQQLDPTKGWDDPGSEERSAEVEDGTFIGWNAIIVGPVTIEQRSYVCAGALVTRNVPSGHVAYGRNQIIPYQEWRGMLGKSPFFRPRPVEPPGTSITPTVPLSSSRGRHRAGLARTGTLEPLVLR